MRLPAAPSAALLVLLAALALFWKGASASSACTAPIWARPEEMVVVLAGNNPYYSWAECKSLAPCRRLCAAVLARKKKPHPVRAIISWCLLRFAPPQELGMFFVFLIIFRSIQRVLTVLVCVCRGWLAWQAMSS